MGDSPDLSTLHNDEILARVVRKLRLTPLSAAFWVFLYNLISGVILAQSVNAWNPTANARGALADTPTWLFELLLHPLAFAYFVWLQTAAQSLYKPLLERDFGIPQSHINACLNRAGMLMQNSRLFWISFGFAILAGAATATVFLNPLIFSNRSWLTAHPLLAWTRALSYSIVIYTLTLVVCNSAILIDTLGKILNRADFVFYPLDPDNAGGLGSVGRFSANFAYIGAACGIVLAVTAFYEPGNLILFKDYVLLLYFLLYFAIVPLLFIAPLWKTHLSMKKYRDSLILALAIENHDYLKRISEVPSPRPDSGLVHEFVHFLDLEKAYGAVKEYPTWPFGTSSLRKFLGLTVAPLVPVLVSVVQELWLMIVV